MWVSERTFQSVIERSQNRPKLIAICRENVNSSRIKPSKFRFSGNHVQGRPLLRASFAEGKRAGAEIESGHHASSVRHDTALFPMQPSRNHQVEHQPKFVVESNGYPLSDS